MEEVELESLLDKFKNTVLRQDVRDTDVWDTGVWDTDVWDTDV